MKNLVYLTLIAFFLVNIDINANIVPLKNVINENATLLTNAILVPEQALIRPRTPVRFSLKCDCDAVIVIQRGLDIKTGRPYIKEWVKFPGEFRLHELKLDEGAETNPALVITCTDICNGNLPLAD